MMKKLIKEVVLIFFVEKGYDGIVFLEIVKVVGIKILLLYVYFVLKEVLFLEVY